MAFIRVRSRRRRGLARRLGFSASRLLGFSAFTTRLAVIPRNMEETTKALNNGAASVPPATPASATSPASPAAATSPATLGASDVVTYTPSSQETPSTGGTSQSTMLDTSTESSPASKLVDVLYNDGRFVDVTEAAAVGIIRTEAAADSVDADAAVEEFLTGYEYFRESLVSENDNHSR